MVCSFWSTPHSYRQGAGLIIPSDTFKGHGLRVSSPTESTFLFTPESRGFLDLIPPELSNLSINGMISNLRIYIYISSHSIHPGFPRLPQASVLSHPDDVGHRHVRVNDTNVGRSALLGPSGLGIDQDVVLGGLENPMVRIQRWLISEGDFTARWCPLDS